MDESNDKKNEIMQEIDRMNRMFMTIPKSIRINPKYFKELISNNDVVVEVEGERNTQRTFSMSDLKNINIIIDPTVESYKMEY